MKPSCGCCAGVAVVTPHARWNRPGLSALRYRVGTYGQFLETMQARLSSQDFPELRSLTTREGSDPAMALLDAWAVVGEVLTFYQERIANEAYLRTATERRSVLELARLVGYRLRPGVAASVHLAYTIEKDAAPALIPSGSRSNSIPSGPDEKMQSFETSEALAARHEWNRLQPRMTRTQSADSIRASGRIYFAGTSTGLKANDILLLQTGASSRPSVFRVQGVAANDAASRTVVNMEPIKIDSPAAIAALVADAAIAMIVTCPMPALVPDALTALKTLGPAEDDIDGMVREALSALDEVQSASSNGAFVAWAGEAKAALIEAAGIVAPPALAPSASRGDRAARFRDFLEVLDKPPSLAPASARKLVRDSREVFAPEGDIYPKLLARLMPRAAPQLYAGLRTREAQAPQLTVTVLRRASGMFGHNAPLRVTAVTNGVPSYGERGLEVGDRKVVELDGLVDKLNAGGYAFIERPGLEPLLATVLAVDAVSLAKYGITGRVSQLTIDQDWLPDGGEPDLSILRGMTVHVLGEVLPLAEEPVQDPVGDNDLVLDALYEGLESGRWLIISGERVPQGSNAVVRGSELLMLSSVRDATFEDGKPRTVITLAVEGGQKLAYRYLRESVALYGNVVRATHGESRDEVLGSGDAAQALQSFVLRQPPLTFVSAPTITGAASTLEVRVNDVLWHETASMAALGADERKYATRTGDDGRTTVVFGDGTHGARLPTGPENVRARYRNGIGAAGNVKAGQISLLATRPLGVKDVLNPLPAGGGANPETRDRARRNAPLAVTALDRLVSTSDYADFARLFAGVAKASASRLPVHGREVVCITIAGVDDAPIEVSSDLYRNLNTALRRYGDPHLAVHVALRELLVLVIAANVKVLEDYDWEFVEPEVRAALLAAFGFDSRELGQGVASSEVISVIQRVPGVAWVELAKLDAVDRDAAIAQFVESDNGDVAIHREIVVKGVLKQAQLLVLQPDVRDTLILNEVTS